MSKNKDLEKQIDEMAIEIAKNHCKPSGCGSCYLEQGTMKNSCEKYLEFKKMAKHLILKTTARLPRLRGRYLKRL